MTSTARGSMATAEEHTPQQVPSDDGGDTTTPTLKPKAHAASKPPHRLLLRPWRLLGRKDTHIVLGSIARLTVVLGLGLLASYYIDKQLIPRASSRLVSDQPDFAYTLGRFTVQWDRSAAQLSVVHKRYWCITDCTVSAHPNLRTLVVVQVRVRWQLCWPSRLLQ